MDAAGKSGLDSILCTLTGKSLSSETSSAFSITPALVSGIMQGGAAHLATGAGQGWEQPLGSQMGIMLIPALPLAKSLLETPGRPLTLSG